MFKARLTSGHLGVATLRFDIYPTSWTVKRFKFKIHNQICNCRKIVQRLLTNIAFTFSKLQQKGSGLAVGLSFQLSVIEREKKKSLECEEIHVWQRRGEKKKRILIHSEVVQQNLLKVTWLWCCFWWSSGLVLLHHIPPTLSLLHLPTHLTERGGVSQKEPK